jgi:hypothetical protein
MACWVGGVDRWAEEGLLRMRMKIDDGRWFVAGDGEKGAN